MGKLMWVLAASVALAPVAAVCAAETAEKPAADAAAKPKKKLALKTYTAAQFAKAQAEAAKNDAPILAIVMIEGDPASAQLKKLLMNKPLFKTFVASNFTTVIFKGKKGPKGIDMASFKKDQEFIEKNILSDSAAKDDPPDRPAFYPAAFIVSSDASKKLAHMPKYNPELGFGAWAMEAVAKLEQAGVTVSVSAALKKEIENPKPDVRMSTRGKKK